MLKVLQVGASRNTLGGVATVLREWEKSSFWKDYHCKWLQTQDNRCFAIKLFLLIKSSIESVFIIPKYDIIHFHTTPGRSIIVQMPIFLLALLYHKNTIIELHVGNQLQDFIDDGIFNWVLNKANKIVVLAHVWKHFLIDYYSIDKDKIKVIYNPAPIVEATPAKDNYILFMAYLVENKGYDIVIKAFSQSDYSLYNWRLVIAGAGEIERAKSIAKDCGVEDRVDFLGWVSGKKRHELWQRAGAYCMASFQEGFPMTVLEAWAYGAPLITTPVGGLLDVLNNGDNALVFSFGDIESLSHSFNMLYSSGELRERLSKTSILLANTIFSMKTIRKDIALLYDSFSRSTNG